MGDELIQKLYMYIQSNFIVVNIDAYFFVLLNWLKFLSTDGLET